MQVKRNVKLQAKREKIEDRAFKRNMRRKMK